MYENSAVKHLSLSPATLRILKVPHDPETHHPPDPDCRGALLAAGVSRVSFVQVVAPAENKDAKLRALEDKHLAALTAAAAEIAAHTSPARLYLTKEIVTGMQLIVTNLF